MSADYSGTSVPTLNNSPASSWATDAAKKSHVNDLYLVTGSGTSAGNLYAFEEYAMPLVKNATPGEIVTFTDGGDNAPITSASVSLSPIQSGSGDPSPTNIRPISGHTGAELIRTGKNLLDDEERTLLYNAIYFGGATGADSGDVITLPPGTYTFSVINTDGSVTSLYAKDADASTNVSGFPVYNVNSKTFTLTERTRIRFWAYKASYSSVDDVKTTQLELGSSATEYEPYDGDTYSVTFPETIYSGSHDFVSGEAVSTMASIDLGTLNYTYMSLSNGRNAFVAEINGIKPHTSNDDVLPAISSMYSAVSYNNTWQNGNMSYTRNATGTDNKREVTFINNAYTDAASFKTAMAGQTLVYELENPLEYTLTAQQLTTIQGQNVVWGSGPITQLTYTSNQFTPSFDWFETWTVPKITRDNGQVIVLPKPQEYTPEIYDVDAATTGRNAAGTMIRDRVARKHKFNYKFAALSQQDATEILNAVQDVSFTLTIASPETGAKTNYRVYVGDRSLPVYWMPTHATASWMYSSLSLNLIEM